MTLPESVLQGAGRAGGSHTATTESVSSVLVMVCRRVLNSEGASRRAEEVERLLWVNFSKAGMPSLSLHRALPCSLLRCGVPDSFSTVFRLFLVELLQIWVLKHQCAEVGRAQRQRIPCLYSDNVYLI